jgi:hypothetical protein
VTSLILAVVLLIVAILLPRLIPAPTEGAHGDHVGPPAMFRLPILAGRIVLALVVLYLVASTSIIQIPADRVGVVTKIYGAFALPEGHIIATKGETGIQAEPIPPGTFKISPFFNILNHVNYLPIVTIPNGFYGRIVARDGAELPAGNIMGDAWSDEEYAKMLDAKYFMTHGGQKGLQLSVLKPGAYPINTALFQVKVGYKARRDQQKQTDDVWDQDGYHQDQTPLDTSITVVPAGYVGVVRSSVQDKGKDCRAIQAKADTSTFSPDSLTAEVVPQGCRGVWQYALPPNDYYLNRDAYDVALVDTKVQALEFKGGYTRRYLDLKVNSQGEFAQSERSVVVPRDQNAVDDAVYTKAEGWEIPQELRVVLQISPERAPIIVAAVGGLKEVEQRIMIPSIRSHVRNVFGGDVTITEPSDCPTPPCPAKATTRQTRVLDTIEKRPLLEDEILRRVAVDGKRAGVDVKEIRLGDSAIPPELLLARQREQLAEQLKRAFIQEQAAQRQRQDTEQARATADQQRDLVTAQINLKTSQLRVEQRTNDGMAEEKYLEGVAAGQKAQTDVLGADRVMMLNVVDKILAQPEVLTSLMQIRLPSTVVFGSGGLNFDSVAAIMKGGSENHSSPNADPKR